MSSSPRVGRAGAPWSIAAGLAAIALLAAAMLWWSGAPLAPPGERAAAEVTSQAAGEEVRAEPAAPEPTRIAADAATAVRGVVCNADGSPLPDLEVLLLREGQRPLPPGVLDLKNTFGRDYAPQRASSGADGSFAFVDLEPATYQLKLGLHQRVQTRVSLAAGETRHVELRFAEQQTLLVGHVTSGGEPLARAHLELFVGKDYLTHGVTDRFGDYRILVAKGQLRICVVSDVRSLPGAHRGPYLHEQVVVVPAQAAVQRCDFDV
ncbi:MAG TPA: carboxypeptidase-like regulatory domain-containing protein, partial [Planctomycetota bacterium]|nr:carboxypeptidase-like regulatory domain-containing protein [Planctomycetota bacterium]